MLWEGSDWISIRGIWESLTFVFLPINYLLTNAPSAVDFLRAWSWLFLVRIKTEMSSWNTGNTGTLGNTQQSRGSLTLVSMRRCFGDYCRVESSGTLHKDAVGCIGNVCMASMHALHIRSMKQEGDHAEGMVLSSHRENFPRAHVFVSVPSSAAGKSMSVPPQDCLFPFASQRWICSLTQSELM